MQASIYKLHKINPLPYTARNCFYYEFMINQSIKTARSCFELLLLNVQICYLQATDIRKMTVRSLGTY
jgi:hypothetical protein